MRRRRAGFTFIEILMSMTIIAILAGIVIPKTGDFIKRAKAAAVVANLNTLRSAVMDYQADSTGYPPTAAMGEVPPTLVSYLPLNFSFQTTDYTLRYNHWRLDWAPAGYTAPMDLVGFTVETRDVRLGQLVLGLMSGYPSFQSGIDYTFIVIGL